MPINQFNELLDEFESLPLSQDATLLEIAGYPHYESVSSNLLRFFLDPDKPHGFSDLCLKALLSVKFNYEPLSDVNIELEVVTPTEKRIDLVIESNTQLIGIENKIRAQPNNPFDDYASFLKERSHERNLELKMLLLTVFPVPTNQNFYGFVHIPYSKFFDNLCVLLDEEYKGEQCNKYLVLLRDFIETIKNLERGSKMDAEMIALFRRRGEDIYLLVTERNNFLTEMKKKITELAGLIECKNLENVKSRNEAKGKEPRHTLIYDIRISDELTVAIDCMLSAKGWRILAFDRKRPNADSILPVSNLFDRLCIPYAVSSNDGGTRLEHIYPYPYAYTEPLPTIQTVVQDWINKLLESSNY